MSPSKQLSPLKVTYYLITHRHYRAWRGIPIINFMPIYTENGYRIETWICQRCYFENTWECICCIACTGNNMLTEERIKQLAHISKKLEHMIEVEKFSPFTEEEEFHLRTILSQVIRRHTLYGGTKRKNESSTIS